MCLGNQKNNNGIMEIGQDYSKDSCFIWTPIETEQWYIVWMTDWFIGKTSLGVSGIDLNWDNVIVDSGTTLIFVLYWVMDPIKTILAGLCNTTKLVGICNVKKGQSNAIP